MNKKTYRKMVIRGLAWASLFIAFFMGQSRTIPSDLLHESALVQKYQIDEIGKEKKQSVAYHQKEKIAYLSQASAQGYGGRLQVLVLSDTLGKIKDIDLLHHTETFAYVAKLRNKRYFEQYQGKKVNDAFLIEKDLSAVSGATISSKAIAEACREASHQLASDSFHWEIPERKSSWQISHWEVLVVLLFLLGASSLHWKKKSLRYAALSISFILIGFLLNASLSVAHFAKVFLGYFPDIKQHLIWYILLFGNILAILLWKRNVYCQSLCPFHAAQLLLHKISGINLKMAPQFSKILIHTPKFLLWLSLLLIFLSKNPTLASYEPFALFFSLEGMGIQWYILPFALIGALFVSDFFCHYFCPVGAGFQLLLSGRRAITKKLKNQNE